jgi:hypothetical protein
LIELLEFREIALELFDVGRREFWRGALSFAIIPRARASA